MSERSAKRQLVWYCMLQLEQDGLGYRQQVSYQHDKFMLDSGRGTASLLSRRLGLNGFIRSDRTGCCLGMPATYCATGWRQPVLALRQQAKRDTKSAGAQLI